MTMTPQVQSNVSASDLHISLELSLETWKIGFADRLGRNPRLRDVPAGDFQLLRTEIRRAKQHFQLPEECPVYSIYEAGRDGFWIHRVLISLGIENMIIDSASLETTRRKRNPKTDRIDARKLVSALMRYRTGDKTACRVIRIPDHVAEDARHLHREMKTLKAEKTQHTNRIGSLLAIHGIRKSINARFGETLDATHTGDGQPLGDELRERLKREFRRLQLAVEQIRELQQQQAKILRQAEKDHTQVARHAQLAQKLMMLGGIGPVSSWTLSAEVFAWRDIANRRQLGALAGLTPTPYNSGSGEREQGISKSGRGDLRSLMIEIAWGWVRWQPDSELTKWYQRRFVDNKRSRKQGIVALARKLLTALGKYIREGEIPAGARLKKGPLRHTYMPSLSA